MKKVLFALLILIIIGLGFGFFAYQMIFSPNVNHSDEPYVLYIPSNSGFDEVSKLLSKNEIIKNEGSFLQVSKLMKYNKESVPSGKYTIKSSLSNKELISLLRSGNQTPVKVTFNNLRTSIDLAGRISSYLEVDSVQFSKILHDPKTLQSLSTSPENLISNFIPNTYETYWDVKPDKIINRLKDERDKWWSQNDRAAKADEIGMTQEEVYVLASIVEKESLRNDEKPIIAGVYLNRLKTGIPLQADPTVVFGIGNFEIRRVLNKHLEYDSPYNTYMYAGLPPGPICMPSITSLDAVINYKKHNLLYFCAKPESNGGHLFAASLTEHNANARVYHRWLDKQGIR